MTKKDRINRFSEVFEVKNGSLWKAYEQLELYVSAYHPLIFIQSFDFAVVDSMIARIAENVFDRKININEYVNGVGAVSFHDEKRLDENLKNETLADILKDYALPCDNNNDQNDEILLLKNINDELKLPNVQSLLRQIALIGMNEHGGVLKYGLFVIIVSPEVYIPSNLERFFAFIKLDVPTETEIVKHLEYVSKYLCLNKDIKYDENDWKDIAPDFHGLTIVEIDQVMSLILADNCDLKSTDNKKARDIIKKEKREIIQKCELLKLVDSDIKPNDIGGLEEITEYLTDQSKIYKVLDIAKQQKVPIPKGILIVGMPGCGKTMTAKWAATVFNVSLICLDIGRLMGAYVGQSEANLRRVLEMIQSIAPCILWVDEMEKAFSGVGSGHGGGAEVTTRLFGHFLTWMQEKPDGVYVIATANRINLLPPELLRRGRFDEVFRVDFPNENERKKIFEVYVNQHKPLISNITEEELDLLASKTDGYCGADISAIIGNACKNIFINNQRTENEHHKVEYKDLINEIKKIIPLKKTLAHEIMEINTALNQYSFRLASKND